MEWKDFQLTQNKTTEPIRKKDNPLQLGCLVHGTKVQRTTTLHSVFASLESFGVYPVAIYYITPIIIIPLTALYFYCVMEGSYPLDQTIFKIIIMAKVEFVKHFATRKP